MFILKLIHNQSKSGRRLADRLCMDTEFDKGKYDPFYHPLNPSNVYRMSSKKNVVLFWGPDRRRWGPGDTKNLSPRSGWRGTILNKGNLTQDKKLAAIKKFGFPLLDDVEFGKAVLADLEVVIHNNRGSCTLLSQDGVGNYSQVQQKSLYIPYGDKYRVHFFCDEVIAVEKKVRKGAIHPLQTTDNGYFYEKVPFDESCKHSGNFASQIYKTLGLDVCAIDVVRTDDGHRLTKVVLAPSLNNVVEDYADAIVRFVDSNP